MYKEYHNKQTQEKGVPMNKDKLFPLDQGRLRTEVTDTMTQFARDHKLLSAFMVLLSVTNIAVLGDAFYQRFLMPKKQTKETQIVPIIVHPCGEHQVGQPASTINTKITPVKGGYLIQAEPATQATPNTTVPAHSRSGSIDAKRFIDFKVNARVD